MLLSRPGIIRHMKKGNIVIDPFDDRKLKTVSYDVTLGDWYWRECHPRGRSTVHNMYDEDSTKIVWEGPFQAEPAAKVAKHLNLKLDNIKSTDKVILLGPGETILGHTIEYIGGRNVCVSKLYARSSLGRNFIEVCKDAGWGDIGYFNRWTMEITNNSRYFTIPLVVNRRIGQMVFYETEALEQPTDYVKDSTGKGKYQTSEKLSELKRIWNPHQMLPQMHRDWEVERGK